VAVSWTDLFTIDPTTGEISTGQPLAGYSRPNSYLINVTAEADNPPRINSTIVAIRIHNQTLGDNRPFVIRPERDGQQFSFESVPDKVIQRPVHPENLIQKSRTRERLRP